jgi:DNA-binding NtrC family response regulator
VKTNATVLIADRNPHVREFLKRELAAAGFTVLTADSGRDLLQWAFGTTPIDLLVIDPDLPDMEPDVLLRKLAGRIPPCPLVIHTLPGEEAWATEPTPIVAYVEKAGRSIEQLKEVITGLLSQSRVRNCTCREP